MTADRDPWAIPAFLRRTDDPSDTARRAREAAIAPRLHTEPLIPTAPAPRVALQPRRSRVRLSERRGRWYYTIRGGYTGGPFDTRDLAQAAARRAQGRRA